MSASSHKVQQQRVVYMTCWQGPRKPAQHAGPKKPRNVKARMYQIQRTAKCLGLLQKLACGPACIRRSWFSYAARQRLWLADSGRCQPS